MKKFILTAIAALILGALQCRAQEPVIKPSETHRFAKRDTCELFLDIYRPANGSVTTFEGKTKPTVLFLFGGGFISGSRSTAYCLPFYKALTENGYQVVAIDYRLGLKGVKGKVVNSKFIDKLDNAIEAAVEDLFSATQWLIENGREHGIDPDSLIVGGSSAGAITSLQAEWEICNNSLRAQVLPEDFNYLGVMSFSGAIFSKQGAIKYAKEPCPHLMLHGTADKLVPYRQIWLFKLRFAGTDVITKTFANEGYNYNTLRFDGYAHEIAASMVQNLPESLSFIEDNILRESDKIIDATIVNPEIKKSGMGSHGVKDLYD